MGPPQYPRLISGSHSIPSVSRTHCLSPVVPVHKHTHKIQVTISPAHHHFPGTMLPQTFDGTVLPQNKSSEVVSSPIHILTSSFTHIPLLRVILSAQVPTPPNYPASTSTCTPGVIQGHHRTCPYSRFISSQLSTPRG